jgi:hypothetical protein
VKRNNRCYRRAASARTRGSWYNNVVERHQWMGIGIDHSSTITTKNTQRHCMPATAIYFIAVQPSTRHQNSLRPIRTEAPLTPCVLVSPVTRSACSTSSGCELEFMCQRNISITRLSQPRHCITSFVLIATSKFLPIERACATARSDLAALDCSVAVESMSKAEASPAH